MKFSDISNKLSKSVNQVGFKIKKHSPEILIVAGVVGTVTSAVMACKATTKISTILDETKDTIDTIHTYMENGVADENIEYTKEDGKKDLAITYVQTGVKLAKLYGPSIVLGSLSITSILASNNILRQRNVALAAAYATVDKSFKEYRHRVVERFGEEMDKELRYNIKAKEIEETITDAKGKEKTVKKTVGVANLDGYSEYARFFNQDSCYWENDIDYNLMFLKARQQYANDMLKAKGHITLNEVYEMLGLPTSKAGMVVGWIYDDTNPVGDNFVDFGISDIFAQRDAEVYERSIILDFNVDGNIYNAM